jgi:hypothetical protein
MNAKCAIGFLENGSTVKLPDGRTGIKERECDGSYAGKVIIRLEDNSAVYTDWSVVVQQVGEAACGRFQPGRARANSA